MFVEDPFEMAMLGKKLLRALSEDPYLARQILLQYPVLLEIISHGSEGITSKAQMEEQRIWFETINLLLKRCKSVGVERAFDEYIEIIENPARIAEAFGKFLQASTTREIENILNNYPILMSPIVEPLVRKSIARVTSDQTRQFAAKRLALLRECREVGISQALERALDEEIRTAMEAVESLLRASSWREVKSVIKQYPILQSEKGVQLLRYLAKEQRGPRRRALEEHADLLEECIERGIDETLERYLPYD